MINYLEMWSEINERIDRLDFNKLWPAFKRYDFAVYNDEEVCFNGDLMAKTDGFLANTAIQYKGQWIAIFSVDEKNLDQITSKIVHEMVLCFSNEKPR